MDIGISEHGDFCCSKVGSFLEFLHKWILKFLNMGISSSAVGCRRMEWLP
jgi:hypothetical protein